MVVMDLVFKLVIFGAMLAVAWWIVTKVPMMEPIRWFVQIVIYCLAGLAVLAFLYKLYEIGLPGLLNSM